jgi:hypothetical protein
MRLFNSIAFSNGAMSPLIAACSASPSVIRQEGSKQQQRNKWEKNDYEVIKYKQITRRNFNVLVAKLRFDWKVPQ